MVQTWLESIRSTGMDARFTTVWNPSARRKAESLLGRLCDYLHEPTGLPM